MAVRAHRLLPLGRHFPLRDAFQGVVVVAGALRSLPLRPAEVRAPAREAGWLHGSRGWERRALARRDWAPVGRRRVPSCLTCACVAWRPQLKSGQPERAGLCIASLPSPSTSSQRSFFSVVLPAASVPHLPPPASDPTLPPPPTPIRPPPLFSLSATPSHSPSTPTPTAKPPSMDTFHNLSIPPTHSPHLLLPNACLPTPCPPTAEPSYHLSPVTHNLHMHSTQVSAPVEALV